MTPPHDAAPAGKSRGRLLVLSGPSGVGKSAVADRLLRDPHFGRAITATTRRPRLGEVEGVDYYFLLESEFEKRIANDWFLEYADVYGRMYGTPRSSVEAVRLSGQHCVLVIDVQGAATLRREQMDAMFVFLEPPSRAELERRLRARGGDDEPSVARRIEDATHELAQAKLFAHRLVNHDLDATARTVASLVGVTLA